MPTDTEIAWLAGLLEGEGCFLLHSKTSPTIQLAMTDLDIVVRAANIMGIHISHIKARVDKRPGCKTMYVFRCGGLAAINWIKLIRPYLGERRGNKVDDILSAIKPSRPYIELGKDFCQQCGGSVKNPWEYYLKMNGSRVCRRCNGYRVAAPTAKGCTRFINPFAEKKEA